MASITILSGSPGTGKTTVAALLAATSPRGVHIPSDVFYTFFAHPIPDVVLDGIVGPWFLPLVTRVSSATPAAVHYVVLQAPLTVALERVRRRADPSDEQVVRKMHGELADLGAYAHHAVDTTDRSAADVAAKIRAGAMALALP